MSKVDRMKILIRYAISQGIAVNQKDFGCKLGYSNETTFSQIVNGRLNPSKKFDQKLTELIQDVNLLWLETGEGSMLKVDATAQSFEDAEKKDIYNKEGIVLIPSLNLDVRGGFADNQETDVAEYINGMIPFSKRVACEGDFVIPVHGDSMYPRYPSGSQLLIRPVEAWHEYLEFGNSYVIELNDGRRVVKIVKKGSDNDHFLLVSVNPDFEPQEIPLSIISRVFLVKLMLKNEGV